MSVRLDPQVARATLLPRPQEAPAAGPRPPRLALDTFEPARPRPQPLALAPPPPKDPSPATVMAEARREHRSQFEDADQANANCGPVSVLNALDMLEVPYSIPGTTTYAQAQQIRKETSGAPTADGQPLGKDHLLEALRENGAHADEVTSTEAGDGGNKKGFEAYMKRALQDPTRQEVFIVRGNPDYANGEWDAAWEAEGREPFVEHWVTVADYDPATDKFLIMDPGLSEPMWVSPAELRGYMSAPTGTDVIEVWP